MSSTSKQRGAPDFESSKNKRQKVRAAGLHPDYWYAVEHSNALKKGKAQEVVFWEETRVAIYRDERGVVRAIEDRCAHRQLPLSIGNVKGDRIVCDYHGWEYDTEGKLAHVPHDTFGKPIPSCKVKTFAVRERYGLIWVFFGAKDKAASVPMPEIPELEGPDSWACVPIDFTWNAHHSMIIDNVSDFTHEFLHRKYKPFVNSKLTKLETKDDKVFVSYDTKVGYGKISGLFVDRKAVDTNSMELCYHYPYQWSNTDDQIKHWCFVLPIGPQRTRVFFLFYFKSFKVPFLPIKIPREVMEPFLKVSNRVLIRPLLSQDGVAVEAEQRGYERYFNASIAELSPAVHAFQALTVKKWEEHLAAIQSAKLVPGERLAKTARDAEGTEAPAEAMGGAE